MSGYHSDPWATDDRIEEALIRDGFWPVTPRDTEPDPGAALEQHVALIRALRHHRFPEPASRAYQTAMADSLDRAATIVVTHDMLDFVLERMQHVPFGQPLEREMLPFAAGYVVLPRLVKIPLDPDDKVTDRPHILPRFDQGAWVPADVTDDADSKYPPSWLTDQNHQVTAVTAEMARVAATGRDGIAYFQICSEASVDAVVEASGLPGNYQLGAPLPVYSSGWQYGLSWDPAERSDDFMLTVPGEWERRFWLSLFTTLNDQVEPVRPRLDRPTIRRAMRAREAVDIPEIVVCNLRMLKKTDKAGNERTVRPKPNWTHRWRSRAHNRTLYRGTPNERVVPVRASVKGPEWAPLIEKDRVYRLAR